MDHVFSPIVNLLANTAADELSIKNGLLEPREYYIKRQVPILSQMFEDHFLKLKQTISLAGDLLKNNLENSPFPEKETYKHEFTSAFEQIIQLGKDPASLAKNQDLLLANTFQEFLGLSNKTLLWIYQTGHHFFSQNQFEEAYAIFKLLTTLNSLTSDYWVALALTQRRLHKEEEALDSFSIATLLNPENPITRYNSAELYLHLGEKDNALAELHELEKLIEKAKLQDLKIFSDDLRAKITSQREVNKCP